MGRLNHCRQFAMRALWWTVGRFTTEKQHEIQTNNVYRTEMHLKNVIDRCAALFAVADQCWI